MAKSRVQQVLKRIMKYKKYFRCEVKILKNYDDMVILHVGYDQTKDNNPTYDTHMIVIGEKIGSDETPDSITIVAVKECQEECYGYYNSFKKDKLVTLDEQLLELIINGYEAPEPVARDLYYDSEGFVFDDDGNLHNEGDIVLASDFDDMGYIYVDEKGKVIRA